MKRFLSAIIVLVMLLSWVAIGAAALDSEQDEPVYDLSFAVDEAEAKNIPTRIVPVAVNITKNNGYISGWLDVAWDNTVFALISVEYSDIAPMNTAVVDPEDSGISAIENTGVYRIYLGDHITQGLDNFTGVGAALTLSFEILPDAVPGDYPITIAETEFQQTDMTAPDLLVEGASGTIKLNAFTLLLGDVDLDEKVDIFDASSIQKSIAGTSGYPIYAELSQSDVDFRIADVDADGKVDIFDASLIQKYIAGSHIADGYGIGDAMA